MGERWKRIGIKMGSLARVCFCEQITFPDGEAEASGQWGREGWSGLQGQAGGHNIFIRLFKSSVSSWLIDPPLINYSEDNPFAHSSASELHRFGVYIHRCGCISHTHAHTRADDLSSHFFQGQRDI